jgi:hypothetical protein
MCDSPICACLSRLEIHKKKLLKLLKNALCIFEMWITVLNQNVQQTINVPDWLNYTVKNLMTITCTCTNPCTCTCNAQVDPRGEAFYYVYTGDCCECPCILRIINVSNIAFYCGTTRQPLTYADLFYNPSTTDPITQSSKYAGFKDLFEEIIIMLTA